VGTRPPVYAEERASGNDRPERPRRPFPEAKTKIPIPGRARSPDAYTKAKNSEEEDDSCQAT